MSGQSRPGRGIVSASRSSYGSTAVVRGSSDDIATRPARLLTWSGSGFNIGSSSNLFYQGQYLADQEDVVVVTMKHVLSGL